MKNLRKNQKRKPPNQWPSGFLAGGLLLEVESGVPFAHFLREETTDLIIADLASRGFFEESVEQKLEIHVEHHLIFGDPTRPFPSRHEHGCWPE